MNISAMSPFALLSKGQSSLRLPRILLRQHKQRKNKRILSQEQRTDFCFFFPFKPAFFNDGQL